MSVPCGYADTWCKAEPQRSAPCHTEPKMYGAGQIIYHGPKEYVLEFFEGLGFQLPYRKGVADFLQASVHPAYHREH